MEICHLQAFDRFVSKKLYYISLSSIYEKLHHKIEKLLEKQQIWTGKKYTLCQKKVSVDTNLRMFQCRILNNIVFLNNKDTLQI